MNLLPTEISEGAKFRNLQAALALTVVLALGVVGGFLTLPRLRRGQRCPAAGRLGADPDELQGEVASYVSVPKLYAQVALANAQLAQAMGQEVRYSFVLRDLSLSIPSTVYLTTMTVAQPVDTPGTVIGAWGGAGVANITFHGQVGKLNDVAAWLDSLTKSKYYSDPYVTVATRLSAGATQPFQFDSSVIVTSKALTGRYPDKAGS